MSATITVLDDGPCACCERNPRGCTDGPSGPCCPCCSGTGREFWPYENQEAARVFAAATLAAADAIEGAILTAALDPWAPDSVILARRQIRKLRASVHIVGVMEEVELPGAFCVAEIVEVSA